MDVVNIIGVLATVISAFITFYGVYLARKNDDKPVFLFKDHSRFVYLDNSVKVYNNDFSVNDKTKASRPRSKSETELVAYIFEISSLIKDFKKIAAGVSLFFTLIYFFLIYFGLDFFGTHYIKQLLLLNSSLFSYFFVYGSLLVFLYSFIIFVASFFYTKEFQYQAKIRGFLDIDKLSRIKRMLLRQHGFKKYNEFPVRMIARAIENIRIEKENVKSISYNNRTKHTPRKQIINYRSDFSGNVYFKAVALVVILNGMFLFFSTSHMKNKQVVATLHQNYFPDICKKRDSIVNVASWSVDWKAKYANEFCNFELINTPNGYYLLNSPDSEDIYQFKYEENVIVSGFVEYNSVKFLFTKYSFDSSNPKFIHIP